jgi:hypothetical protein
MLPAKFYQKTIRPKGEAEGKPTHILYECGICSCYHPWDWDGDCRDDASRYGTPEDYIDKFGIDPFRLEVRSMQERVEADTETEQSA